jgi:hypothetical protein
MSKAIETLQTAQKRAMAGRPKVEAFRIWQRPSDVRG